MNFILGAWRNLQYTRLASSVILAVPLPALLFVSNPLIFTSPSSWAEPTFFILLTSLQILLFPLARELYFRLTNPVREGIGTLFFAFPLALIYWLLRVAIYVALNAVAIPLGLISFLGQAPGRGVAVGDPSAVDFG